MFENENNKYPISFYSLRSSVLVKTNVLMMSYVCRGMRASERNTRFGVLIGICDQNGRLHSRQNKIVILEGFIEGRRMYNIISLLLFVLL